MPLRKAQTRPVLVPRNREILACDFSGKEFKSFVDFSNKVFKSLANFRGAKFHKGASFLNAEFEQGADFSLSSFDGRVSFWRCVFKEPASFRRMTVTQKNFDGPNGYPGEANFSYARFIKDADLTRARFHGNAYFHRSIFAGTVRFEDTHFDEFVLFQGMPSDICLAPDDIHHQLELIQKLKDCGLLIQCIDNDNFYNFNPRFQTNEDLKMEMRSGILREDTSAEPALSTLIKFDEDEITEVSTALENYRHPMFSPIFDSFFHNTEFDKLVRFADLDLSNTRFEGTSLTNAWFVNVEWDHQPLTYKRGKRAALHDESTNCDKRLLADMYHDLRMNYQKRGKVDQAREFYYGELEASYQWLKPLNRFVSLMLFYKYLSGFGIQQTLAALWLLVFIFIIFPGVFLASQWVHAHSILAPLIDGRLVLWFWEAEHRSLEACTFITPGTTQPYTDADRLIAGVERLTVVLQASLLAVATKWKFERSGGGS